MLLELTIPGLLAYGTVHHFGLEVDWEQYIVRSRTSECQLGTGGGAGPPVLTPASSHSLHLPPVLPVAEGGDPAHHVAGGGLSHLGTAEGSLEVRASGEAGRAGRRAARAGLTAAAPRLRWTQVWGWLRKLCAAVQLFIIGLATAALFVISLVGSTSRGRGRGPKGQH